MDTPTHTHTRWSAPKERIIVQALYLVIIALVCAFIFALAWEQVLDKASVTALYGTVLGHVGTTVGHKLSSRSEDGATGS